MKTDVKNIEASVKGQLQNKAKETDLPYAEVLQYYGMERFLYRFSQSDYAGSMEMTQLNFKISGQQDLNLRPMCPENSAISHRNVEDVCLG